MHTTPLAVDPDTLLDEAEAAQILKLSARTLQMWRVRNVGPAWVHVGRAIRYQRPDLLAWLAQNKCGPVQ